MESEYGISSTYDSHMARYLEWTTASYLTNSTYGRCSDLDTCVEVSRNNSSSFYTGRSDGANGQGTEIVDIGTYTYETTNGQLASTTGNIYGIYDMNGGAWEYVMGALEYQEGVPYVGSNSSSNTGFIGTYSDGGTQNDGKLFSDKTEIGKYYDVFTSADKSINNYSAISAVNGNTNMNGVFKELLGSKTNQTTNWYNDYAGFVYATYPWFLLSGSYNDVYNTNFGSGIFSSSDLSGTTYISYSFRLVMVKK